MKVKPKTVFNRKLINIDLIKITNKISKVKVRVVITIKNSKLNITKQFPAKMKIWHACMGSIKAMLMWEEKILINQNIPWTKTKLKCIFQKL